MRTLIPIEWMKTPPNQQAVLEWFTNVADDFQTQSNEFAAFCIQKLKDCLPKDVKKVYYYNLGQFLAREELGIEPPDESYFRSKTMRHIANVIGHYNSQEYVYGICVFGPESIWISPGKWENPKKFKYAADPKQLVETLNEIRGPDWMLDYEYINTSHDLLGFCHNHEKFTCTECRKSFSMLDLSSKLTKLWGWNKCADCGKFSLAYQTPPARKMTRLRRELRAKQRGTLILPPPPETEHETEEPTSQAYIGDVWPQPLEQIWRVANLAEVAAEIQQGVRRGGAR